MGIVINITDKGVSLVYDQNKMSKESYRELNIILDKLILFSQTQKISQKGVRDESN